MKMNNLTLCRETKKIAVTTDTNSGMMPHEYENQGVVVLPMPFVINGVSMLESIELSRKEFYKQLCMEEKFKRKNR